MAPNLRPNQMTWAAIKIINRKHTQSTRLLYCHLISVNDDMVVMGETKHWQT